MNPPLMLFIIVSLVSLFAWSASRRWALLAQARHEPRFSLKHASDVWMRLLDTGVYAFGQKKMPNYPLAGVAHIFIFLGFMVLLLRSLMLWGRGFEQDFDFFGLLRTGSWLGDGYNIIKDVFALLVILGTLIFVYYRVIRREKRMTLGAEGLFILFIIASMMVADFVYDGASIVAQKHALGLPLRFQFHEPVGSLVAMAFERAQLRSDVLSGLEQVGFWWHATFVLIFLNILPYSKHFHIITAIPNVFTRNHTPRGALPLVEDIEGKVEREESLGLSKAEDLNWKAVLDTYTCTECGRCSDNCPAYTTDKVLSPKHLMIALREHLYDSQARLANPGPKTTLTAQEPTPLTHGDPPSGAYFRSAEPVPLVPGIMHPDVIWGCTTCRACEEQCPVMITFVDKIVGMRREQVLAQSEFPPELQKPFTAMEVNSNPWNLPALDRGSWADGLGVRFVADHPAAPVLYWVGCAASYDDRAKKVARSVAKLLQHAQVDFAILGTEERCTGDPARRAGNEYLFQMLAQANVDTLHRYGAQNKKILTTCPHCFNTLLREYPQFQGNFDVIHHTEFLLELVRAKKLVPEKKQVQKIVYHDSCYLGRYNEVYDAPRAILEAIDGVELEEVPYWNRNKGLCCGAGGAQMWMEEQNQNRVSNKRTLQLVDTGARVLATACPFCSTMLSDGLKAQEKEQSVAQLDVAEILAAAVL